MIVGNKMLEFADFAFVFDAGSACFNSMYDTFHLGPDKLDNLKIGGKTNKTSFT